jgi:hypothetical protein
LQKRQLHHHIQPHIRLVQVRVLTVAGLMLTTIAVQYLYYYKRKDGLDLDVLINQNSLVLKDGEMKDMGLPVLEKA